MASGNVLYNGQVVALASKINYHGTGAGYLKTGTGNLLEFQPLRPTDLDARFQFKLEKPPQKSGGNPDLATIYDGDDVLLRSMVNDKYVRFISNEGGAAPFYVVASEHFAKHAYRSQGQGAMEAFRIVALDENVQRGLPVMLDGQHAYGLVNTRGVAWLSTRDGCLVRASGNAGLSESFFLVNADQCHM